MSRGRGKSGENLRDESPRIGRVSPATKMKIFLLTRSAGCTYSFSLQETYTFQLHFVLHWRAQSDCPRSVSLSMTFSTPYTTAVIVPLLAVVCLEIAWFCFVRPAVVASAPYRINNIKRNVTYARRGGRERGA